MNTQDIIDFLNGDKAAGEKLTAAIRTKQRMKKAECDRLAKEAGGADVCSINEQFGATLGKVAAGQKALDEGSDKAQPDLFFGGLVMTGKSEKAGPMTAERRKEIAAGLVGSLPIDPLFAPADRMNAQRRALAWLEAQRVSRNADPFFAGGVVKAESTGSKEMTNDELVRVVALLNAAERKQVGQEKVVDLIEQYGLDEAENIIETL